MAGHQQGVGRDENVRHVVDDEIQPLAAEPRQPLRDVDPARKRAVDPIDDERHAEPKERDLPGPLPDGEQGE